jgi:apolipoprotein N-acyltransferase
VLPVSVPPTGHFEFPWSRDPWTTVDRTYNRNLSRKLVGILGLNFFTAFLKALFCY